MKKIVLILGTLALIIAVQTSPSYYLIQRNGVTFKMKYRVGKDYPQIQREKDIGEVLGRVLLVSGATGVIYFYVKKKKGRSEPPPG